MSELGNVISFPKVPSVTHKRKRIRERLKPLFQKMEIDEQDPEEQEFIEGLIDISMKYFH